MLVGLGSMELGFKFSSVTSVLTVLGLLNPKSGLKCYACCGILNTAQPDFKESRKFS